MKSFWDQHQPLIGQSPMDGVSDAAFRYITDIYGKPDLLFTEFVSVEGLDHGDALQLNAFIHHQTATPTIAQIYGTTPIAFYQASFIVAELGFNGVDINMGCPDKSVTKRGGGAALILTPKKAQEIIKETKRGLSDWHEGKKIDRLDLHPEILNSIKHYRKKYDLNAKRKLLPLSVKTRIGYDSIVTESWISNLLEMEPTAITLHGRTLRQMYTGNVHWDEIGKAARLAKKTNTIILGNGDIHSVEEAKKRCREYQLGGVLIGRALCGNPWLLQEKIPTVKERCQVALEHCLKFTQMIPQGHFVSLRKHLAWYCKGFNGAAEKRNQLMKVKTLEDVQEITREILLENTP